MREYVLYLRKGRTDSKFTNLRKAGRLDIVHECIEASLFLSHKIRRNVVFNALLSGPPLPPLHLKVDGATLRDVRTDEETWKEIEFEPHRSTEEGEVLPQLLLITSHRSGTITASNWALPLVFKEYPCSVVNCWYIKTQVDFTMWELRV